MRARPSRPLELLVNSVLAGVATNDRRGGREGTVHGCQSNFDEGKRAVAERRQNGKCLLNPSPSNRSLPSY